MRELSFEDVNRIRARAGLGPVDNGEPGYVPSSCRSPRKGYVGPTVRCPSVDAKSNERCWHLQGHDGLHEDKARAEAAAKARRMRTIEEALPGCAWEDLLDEASASKRRKRHQ
jgi:hypothetical protein